MLTEYDVLTLHWQRPHLLRVSGVVLLMFLVSVLEVLVWAGAFGIIMFGWTTAFVIAVVQRVYLSKES